MRRTRTLTVMATMAALLMSFAGPVPASSGKVETPEVPLPEGFPVEARTKIHKALNRPDSKFIGGCWRSSQTVLNYRGETLPLSLFLEDLVRCPGVTVRVSLKRIPDDVDWRVSHDFHVNSFDVQVNLASKRVDLESLYIPSFKGSELKQ